MAFLSWFSKKSSEEDYEHVLASLALSIQKRQTRLSELRLRERRSTLLVTTWAFAGWVAYVALWWAGVIGSRGRGRARSGALWGLPVVVGPLVILFTRRIVQLWYTRKGNAEEKTLKQLLVTQRNKIEEIKKKTNYYSTKNLLDRYDGGPVSGNKPSRPSVQTHGVPVSLQPQPQTPTTQTPATPATSAPSNGSSTPSQSQTGPQTPVRGAATPQVQHFSPGLPPLPAPQKHWYDKVADALLGDDTASTGPPASSRYALICERCFSHNGLVKEDHWEDAQYLCPKCGHFNRSARSRKAGLTAPATPQSTVSASGLSNYQSAISPASPSTLDASNSSPARGAEPAIKSPLSSSTTAPAEKSESSEPEGQGDTSTVAMEVDEQ